MIIKHEHLGVTYQITPEKLHHVLVVQAGGMTFIEDVKPRTLGLNKPLTYAQVCDYAKIKIARMLA